MKIKYILLLLMFLPNLLLADELTKGKKDTIIIGKAKALESVISFSEKNRNILELNRYIDALNAELPNAINSLSIFQLVERDRKAELELEQAYANVAVDPNDEDAAKMFKMSGAKFILMPEVSSFEIRESRTNYNAIARTTISRTVFASLTVKIVDTTKGTTLSSSPTVQLNSNQSSVLARMGTSIAMDKTILFLAKDMANALSKKIAIQLRPAKILNVRGNEVMINRGSNFGFGVNKGIEIYAVQNIVDEDSGEIFGDEVLVGRGTIVRGDEKKSFAIINGENLGIAKGCVVKIRDIQLLPQKKVAVKKKVTHEVVPVGSDEKPFDWAK